MDGISLWHWLIVLIYAFVVVVPMGKIFSRLGLPWALALLMIVPIVNLATLWVVAFMKWPRDKAPPPPA